MAYVFLPFLFIGALLAYFRVPGAEYVMVIGLAVAVYTGWWISRQ